jgi:hypothetical protein
LERIRLANGGLLRPADVVEAARPVKSPLHSRFEWDNAKAAHDYRLWQARELIRVVVTVHPSTQKPFRAYVSLEENRITDGGGYLSTISVLSDAEQREQLLAEALRELAELRKRYDCLRELAGVFAAIDKVAKKAG